MTTEETKTITIPTHLSGPRRVIGPFTRNQVLCILLGIGFSAELYFGLAGLATFGNFGSILRLVIGTLPLDGILLASILSFGGRSLGAWIILFFLYLTRQKETCWCSVCKHDRYAFAPDEEKQSEEKKV